MFTLKSYLKFQKYPRLAHRANPFMKFNSSFDPKQYILENQSTRSRPGQRQKNLRKAHKLNSNPKKEIFGMFKSKNKECETKTQHFEVFKSIVEKQLPLVEGMIDRRSTSYVSYMLMLSARIGVEDKFFFDALYEHIENRIDTITSGQELYQVLISFSLRPDLVLSQKTLLLSLYKKFFQHRYLFTKQQIEVISQTFQQLDITTLASGHKDMFKEMSRNQTKSRALELMGIQLGDQFLVDFDFEHKVIIIKNKNTSNISVIHGGSKQDGGVATTMFAEQLIDTFKPEAVFIDHEPISTSVDHLSDEDQETLKALFQSSTPEDTISEDFIDKFFTGAEATGKDPKDLLTASDKLISNLTGQIKQYFIDYTLDDLYQSGKFNSLRSISKYMNDKCPDSMLILNDLSPSEQNMVISMQLEEEERQDLKRVMKTLSLFEMTKWLKDIEELGCKKCSSYFSREQIQPIPGNFADIMPQEEFRIQHSRSKLMAYNLLKKMLEFAPIDTENLKEEPMPGDPDYASHFLVITDEANYIQLAQELSKFVNDYPSFINYTRPAHMRDYYNKAAASSPEAKTQIIKNWTLANTLQPDLKDAQFYFDITAEDLMLANVYSLKHLKKVTLMDFIDDIPEELQLKGFDPDLGMDQFEVGGSRVGEQCLVTSQIQNKIASYKFKQHQMDQLAGMDPELAALLGSYKDGEC